MKMLGLLGITVVSLWSAEVYATFEAQGAKETLLGMNASGIVKKMLVQNGSVVTKGALLLELDNREEKLSLQMAQADLTAVTHECDFLGTQYARYEKSAQVFDKNTLEKLKTELDTKRSQKQRAQLAVAYAQQKLAKTFLYAPFSGSIGDKTVEVGGMVSGMGGAPLFKLISNHTKLVLHYDSKYALSVNVGDRFCPAIDGKKTGQCTKITRIYPSINPKNHQMSAESDMSGFRAGTFGDGIITTH